MTEILCYSGVTFKSNCLPSLAVAKIEHYQKLCTEIIRLLREERLRRDLTNYAVFKRSGVSQTMLGQVERGLRNPTMELMLRIADGIGVDLPEIIRKAQANVLKSK